MNSFVGIRPQALHDIASRHDLGATDRWLLVALCLHADHRTGLWAGTQGDLADLVGIIARNLRPRLATLRDAGLITDRWPRGHAGHVLVLPYVDLVHLTPAQRSKHPLRPETRNGRNLPLRAT